VIGDSREPHVAQTGQHGHAFVWQNGRMTDLGTPGRALADSSAVAINNRGQIVGTSATGDGGIGKRHLVLWRNAKITDLGTIGGGFYEAVVINERGQIIGNSVPAGGSVVHGFVWQNGTITDLGTLGGAESDVAAINEHDQIVGVSTNANGKRHAVLWTLRALA
jgi:probable HAF family extracellular repeat protein